MKKELLLTALILVGDLAFSTPCLADVWCKKKNGAVFIRKKCQKGEQKVNLAALGLQGPKGDTGSKGDKGEKGDPGPKNEAPPTFK